MEENSNKFKVLIIEDRYEDFIRIQEKLIPNSYCSRLPFDYNVPNEMKRDRKQYLSELNSKISIEDRIQAEKCLTKDEIDLIDVLKEKDNIAEAKKKIIDIVRLNYKDLRLIICDLQLCGDDRGGEKIIKEIRQNHDIIKDKEWFCKNIPIICFTQLVGTAVIDSGVAGGVNCATIKKGDVFSVNNANSTFQELVRLLSENFDSFYNERARKYKVSLSFSGENKLNKVPHFAFVKEFAHYLYSKFTRDRVYFYPDHKDDKNLANDLENIYTNESEFVIVFISSDYNTDVSPITQREWRAIREEYEKKYWKGVIFVPIEKETANPAIIEKLLDIKSFNEKYVDFGDIRDDFFKETIENKQRQKDLNGRTISYKEYNEKTIVEYGKKCEMIYKKIEDEIIRGKMGLN